MLNKEEVQYLYDLAFKLTEEDKAGIVYKVIENKGTYYIYPEFPNLED
jgi:hypothetical protein